MAGARRSRQRRRPDTLDNILLAARDEFSAKGLAGAQVEAIARQAGVTKQVIYYYYESKVGLYEAVVKHNIEQCHTELFEADFQSVDPVAALRRFFGMMYDFFLKMPFLVPLGVDFTFHGSVHVKSRKTLRAVVSLYEKMIDRAVAAGRLPADIDRRTCFVLSMTVISGSFLHREKLWGFADAAPESDERAATRRAKVLNAIMAIMMYGGSASADMPSRNP